MELHDGRSGAFAPLATGPAAHVSETTGRTYGGRWAFGEDFGWSLAPGRDRRHPSGTAHRALDGDGTPTR
ncbi:hypothetical protein BRD17_05495 [Halobacteriales archaeon SW_7_68_16]|nr:MAG: hypothetical protein BRD17_05495 [Halobacteriales archaeon SW_7_68_16]